MPGPTPKPSALKKLGPRQHKKQNKKEPKPATGIPTCPHWLDGIAKYAFKDLGITLDGMKVLTLSDKKALELLVDAYSEYRRARAVVLKEGFTYESPTQGGGTMVRPRPEVQIAQNAWKRCSDMLKQFGLTPSARTGVQMIEEKESDPMEDFLSGGGLKAVK